MPKVSINYLFPPDQIEELPSWRFVLHFEAPELFRERRTRKAAEQLSSATFRVVTFPFGLDELAYDAKTNTVDLPIEVPQERREQTGSLADYESDIWKIFGNMAECGFGDLYYEAVDWRE